MKSFENMSKEDLLEEANLARKASVSITHAIYKYLGQKITQEELLDFIESVISPDIIAEFNHKYIIKDYLGVCGANMDTTSDFEYLNDVDELEIKD